MSKRKVKPLDALFAALIVMVLVVFAHDIYQLNTGAF